MTKVNALLLEAVLLKTSILIVILATIFNTHRNTNHHHQTNHYHHHHHNTNHYPHHNNRHLTNNNNNNNYDNYHTNTNNNNNNNQIDQDNNRNKFTSGLFLQADAYRVPYQYPRYPRLRKEYPAAQAGNQASATRYAASASALDTSIVANIETNEVVHVDMRIRDNSQAHHTQLYEMIDRVNPLNPTGPALVLRRGDPMTVVIHLRNNYQRNTDKIRLEFSFGEFRSVCLIYFNHQTSNKGLTKNKLSSDSCSYLSTLYSITQAPDPK